MCACINKWRICFNYFHLCKTQKRTTSCRTTIQMDLTTIWRMRSGQMANHHHHQIFRLLQSAQPIPALKLRHPKRNWIFNIGWYFWIWNQTKRFQIASFISNAFSNVKHVSFAFQLVYQREAYEKIMVGRIQPLSEARRAENFCSARWYTVLHLRMHTEWKDRIENVLWGCKKNGRFSKFVWWKSILLFAILFYIEFLCIFCVFF